MQAEKLNLGSGVLPLDGYDNIDINNGRKAFPLDVPDESCEEIRASHVLEHLGRIESAKAIAHWTKKLKHGGKLKIAVPDAKKIFDSGVANGKYDIMQEAFLFGGQTDENDFHKSLWTQQKLHSLMSQNGLEEIQPWESEIEDCAALPVSLNMEGRRLNTQKANRLPAIADESDEPSQLEVKIKAVMSVPRYGQLAARGIMERALRVFKLPLHTTQGVFWGQCMDRSFVAGIEENVDWILTLDYDSVFTAAQLNTLFEHLGSNPDIDCLAALQSRRGVPVPLLTAASATELEIEGHRPPIKVTTAHFGLTVIRVDCLKKLPRPWFWSKPNEDGTWGEGRLDDDIYFWDQWGKAGFNIYVDPQVCIGHVEERVAWYNDDLEIQWGNIEEWREAFNQD